MAEHHSDGHNGADYELQRRARRRIEEIDAIAEHQETLKNYKSEDKSDGYNEKALGAVIKGLLKGPEAHADQLAFELEVNTYRQAVGLTTDPAEAQRLALDAKGGLPDAGGEAAADGVFGEADTVQFGDDPPIPAREFARAARKLSRKERGP